MEEAFSMADEDFETAYGFPRPQSGDEVVFYCAAGVRSQMAAELALSNNGIKGINYRGSAQEWFSVARDTAA